MADSSTPAKSFALSLRGLARPEGGSPAGPPRSAALDGLGKALAGQLRQVPRPTGALLFVSGIPGAAEQVGAALAKVAPSLSALVVPGAGVLTELGEIEGAPAVSGVVFGSPRPRVLAGDDASEVGHAIGGGAALAFVATEGFEASQVRELGRGARMLFGAGSPGSGVVAVEQGKVSTRRIGVLRFEAGAPIVESSPACRLVSTPMTVTEVERGVLLRLDDRPALDALGASAGGGRQGGLVLVALHDAADPERFLVRSIRGVDPARRAVAVAAELQVGDRVSFAVRDPSVARADLERCVRRAEQQALGSAPTFAVYLSCGGRGRSLYGESDVDTRILKKRLPRVPFAGMHSAFEIVPFGSGEARVQLMSGVLALFRAPS